MTTKAAPDDRPARRLGLHGVPLGWIGLAVCLVMISTLFLFGYRVGDPSPDSQPYVR